MRRATAHAGALLLLLAGAALLLARPAGAQAVSKPRGGRGGRGRERPTDFDRGGGLRQAERKLGELLRTCGKGVPKGAAVATSRGMYISSLAADAVRVAGFEVRYDGRDYHFSMQKTGGKWNIVGAVTPDPCGTETLALTMDDIDAYNTADLGWDADMSPLVEGKTVEELSRLVMPLEALGRKAAPAQKPAVLPPPAEGDEPAWQGMPPVRGSPSRRQMGAATGPQLPEAYDARARLSTEYPCAAFDVRNQGACGSCSMFAFTAATAGRLCLQHGRDPRHNVVLSPQQLLEAVNGDPKTSCVSGGTIRQITTLYNSTPPRWKEEYCHPYAGAFVNVSATPCSQGRDFASTWGRIVSGDAALRAELLLRGPIYIAVTVYKSFYAYSGYGIYRPGAANDTAVGGHAMALVGWGTENGTPYWIVQNSWGASFGQGGFMRFVRGINAFGIEDETRVSQAVPPAQCSGTVCPMGWRLLATNCTCVPTPSAPPLVCLNGGALVDWRCVCPVGVSGRACESGAPSGPLPDAGVQTAVAMAAASDAVVLAARAAEDASRTVARAAEEAAAAALAAAAAEAEAARTAVGEQRVWFSYGGLPLTEGDSTLWLVRGAAPVCYRIPAWKIFDGRQNIALTFETTDGTFFSFAAALPQVNFSANVSARVPREACGMLGLTGTWWMVKTMPLWRLNTNLKYIATPYFLVNYLRLESTTMWTLNTTHRRLDFAWAWEGGASMGGDMLSIVSRTGAVRYNQTFSNVPKTGAGSFFMRSFGGTVRNGPYFFQLFRANQTAPRFTYPMTFTATQWGAWSL